MGKDRKPLGTLAVAALAAIMLSAVALAVDVDAARGGKGGGRPNGGSPTLTVTPNPVLVGSPSIVISGSGFSGGEDLEIGVMGMTPSVFLTTDGSGSFSTTYSPWGGFTMEGNGTAVALSTKGHTLNTRASTPFKVCSTSPCQW